MGVYAGLDTYLTISKGLADVETYISQHVAELIGNQPAPYQFAIKQAVGIDKASNISFRFDRLKVFGRVWSDDASQDLRPLIFAAKSLNNAQPKTAAFQVQALLRNLTRWGDLKIDPSPNWL
ncbi:MAG: hypothetical protein GY903_21395 [Fuerstiella sp.]|nr:hypothetical protein [Fuerstiella sp.]MCP4857047.1 hypothetical protein [Fuerstiella sp.]